MSDDSKFHIKLRPVEDLAQLENIVKIAKQMGAPDDAQVRFKSGFLTQEVKVLWEK